MRSALVAGLMLTTCACSVADQGRRIGLLNAGIDLPDLPPQCRQAIPHAPLAEGADVVVVLKRERGQLNKANATIGLCAGNYDQIVAEFERGPKEGKPLPDEISR